MKNRYYYIRLVAFLLLAGATFVSCNKEETITGTFTMTVNATKGDSHVKALNPESRTGRPLATWAKDEEVTVYNVTTGQLLTGTLTAQSAGQSTTTLSGDITGTISDNDQLELRFLSPNYSTQDGTLTGSATSIDNVCDYATATVTARVSDDGVTTGDAVFVNQQAIVRFSLQDGLGNQLVPSLFVVRVGNNSYSVIPATTTNELYVAIPEFSNQTVSLFAKTSTDWYILDQQNVTFVNGQYYTVTLNMQQDNYPAPVTIDSLDHKVFFSPGNLQYHATLNKWRFALHQIDYVGDATNGNVYDTVGENIVKYRNDSIAENYNGWIDLFGWGTSGENPSYPYNKEPSETYGPSGDLAGTNYDWGVKNPILNGGDLPGLWRTLTSSEWNYILNRRNCIYRFTKAQIDNIYCGLIIFPDNYVHPTGGGDILYLNTGTTSTWPSFTKENWNAMEAAGAIFLPAAGYRGDNTGNTYNPTGIISAGQEGVYWSASALNDRAYRVLFSNSGTGDYAAAHTTPRYYGYSVRLVRDLQ